MSKKLTADEIQAEMFAEEDWAPRWDAAVKRKKEIEAMEDSDEKKEEVKNFIQELKEINRGACKFRKRNMTIATKLHVADKIARGTFEMFKELALDEEELKARYALFSILRRLSE